MKAERNTAPFVPVTITLESQEEVDAIFAVLNHKFVSASLRVPSLDSELLKPFSSAAYAVIHDRLSATLKSHY